MDVHLETPINASADVVWGILAGKFAEIDQWSTAVDKSWALSPENAPKGWTIAPSAPIPGRATVNRIGELHEWFIQYSEENKEFTFRGHGLPRIITYTANNSKVTPTGENSCVLSFDVHVEFMGPFSLLGSMLKRRMQRQFGHVQAELKAYAETGEISAEKQAFLAQAN